MDRKDLAIEYHNRTYNCAQSVLLALADIIEVDKETAFKIAEGFGGGMGTTYGTCGALSGAIMAAGLKNSDGNLEAPKSKGSTMKLDREMYKLFVEKAGASICRDIKGVETGKVLYSCEDCIRLGVEVAEKVLLGE